MSPARLQRCIFTQILFALAASSAQAASGNIEVRVRDAITHYGIQAIVKLDGPESLSFSTDSRGHFKRELTPGEYREEYSAPGYKPLRSHHRIEAGKITPLGAFLDPETPPEDERPEIVKSKLRPGYTLLHGYIVDFAAGEPVSGVIVRLENAGAATQTDARGHYWLSVPTPAPSVPGRAGTDTLTIRKLGYKTIIVHNFMITDDEMGGTADNLEKGEGTIELDGTHKLFRKEDADMGRSEGARPIPSVASLSPELYKWLGVTGEPFSVGPAIGGTMATQAITVPGSIRVGHTCTQKSCATWDPPISLETYVSNGLPGEWPTSWAADAMKAGAVAYRSYGAWYVAHPISPNYDICDNISCQNYHPEDPRWKPTTGSKAAVAATAGVVLSSDEQSILFAEYAGESNLATNSQGLPLYATCPDGQIGEPNNPTNPWPCMKDPVCKGKKQPSTHSRGMCQRGSQRWASGLDRTGAPGDTNLPILNSDGVPITPRDWRCILNHYYNANSNSITVAPDPSSPAGTGLRTAFLRGAPTYGSVAYEDVSTSPRSIRVASAADGSGDRFLVSGSGPAWAPGDTTLAYRDPSTMGISVINADGTGKKQITSNSGSDPGGHPLYDFNPAWSPLGNKIAFCSNRSGSGVGVWTINPDRTGLAQIPASSGLFIVGDGVYPCYLSWSPDATSIAFTGDTAYVPWPGSGTTYNIYSMYADGSSVLQWTSCQFTSPHELQSVCSQPNWSPDGLSIAFDDADTLGDNIGGGGIYALRLVPGPPPNANILKQIYLSSTTINQYPHWTADGQRIIFGSDQGGQWGIWSMNADGTGAVEIIGGGKGYKGSPMDQLDCSRCAAFDK